MFNLFRMDLRRLFRTRSFYIMLCVTAALLLTMVATMSAITDQKKLDALQGTGMVVTSGDSEDMIELLQGMTRLDFVHECLGSGFLLLLTGIGVTLFVYSDFSSGFIKNLCFARPRRWEYVLSKVLTTGVYSGILTVLGVLVSLVSALLFGIRLEASPVGGILRYTFWMWLPNWAFGLMGLGLVLLTRGSTLGIILAIVSGGGLTAAILQSVCHRFGWPDLAQYLLSMVVGTQCVPMPNMDQINMILGCSIYWAALYAVGSFIAMESRDI